MINKGKRLSAKFYSWWYSGDNPFAKKVIVMEGQSIQGGLEYLASHRSRWRPNILLVYGGYTEGVVVPESHPQPFVGVSHF